jgi:hypothetical protein
MGIFNQKKYFSYLFSMNHLKITLAALLVSGHLSVMPLLHAAGDKPLPVNNQNAWLPYAAKLKKAFESLVAETATAVATNMGLTLTPERIGTLTEQIIENIEGLPQAPAARPNAHPENFQDALGQIAPNIAHILGQNANTIPANRPLWTDGQRQTIQAMLRPMIQSELTITVPGKTPPLSLGDRFLKVVTDETMEFNPETVVDEAMLAYTTSLFELAYNIYLNALEEFEQTQDEEAFTIQKRCFVMRIIMAINKTIDKTDNKEIAKAICDGFAIDWNKSSSLSLKPKYFDKIDRYFRSYYKTNHKRLLSILDMIINEAKPTLEAFIYT